MATHEITAGNIEEAVTGNTIIFLDFWAEWCGPCRAFGPVFEKASQEHPDVYFGKVNVDEQQQIASLARIEAIPTLLVFKDQKLIYSGAGALGAAQLEDLISQAEALDMSQEGADAAEEGAVR